MAVPTSSYGAYKRVDVETASQGKLIILLFNGAIQRAEEAKRQLEKNNLQSAHNNLIRAQEIVGELRGALNMNAGKLAESLDRIYEYFQHLLVQANVRKDAEPVARCVRMMAGVRDTWEELFHGLAKEEQPGEPHVNQHGATVINVQG